MNDNYSGTHLESKIDMEEWLKELRNTSIAAVNMLKVNPILCIMYMYTLV